MITSELFDRIVYRYPKLRGRGKEIRTMKGIDSEAYKTGEPFMFCVSDGRSLVPRDIPGVFFERYGGAHFAVYNLKYDSGAILYLMPWELKEELWEKNACKWDGVRVEYIPHKQLKFTKGKVSVCFWDVSQFYRMSLDKAAKRYLGKGKLDIETKRFTKKYVRENWDSIKKYCVEDARLTAELGTFLVRKLREFGIRVTSLYSEASLSFRYFCDRGRTVTAWRFWKHYKPLLAFAMDAYEGGKFEVTARGTFDGYEYDLVSAYPYEIANLVDITLARIERTKRYQPDAAYGFVRCHVRNPSGVALPCGLMMDNVRVYPAGAFYITITKQEYEYLVEAGVEVDILDGCWLFVRTPSYPYRENMLKLFELKARYKGNDDMLCSVSKYMMNGYYGKTVQMIPNWKDEVVAGAGWNPIYGAIITANTRIKMARLQNELGPRCLAVHTDSVITTEPLPPELVTGRLGEMDFVEKGPGLLVACGQYEVGEQAAYKGFVPQDRDSWRSLLSRYPSRAYFSYPVLHVESWIEAVAKGHRDRINLFQDTTKKIDLNGDIKRTWLSQVRGQDLLARLDYSVPRIVVHSRRPEHWDVDVS